MCRLSLLLLFLLIVNIIAERRDTSSNAPCPGECVCFRRNVRCMRLELDEIPKIPLQTTLL